MDATKGKLARIAILFPGMRVLGVVGGEVSLGLALRWASAPTPPCPIWPGAAASSDGLTLAQLVVAAATYLAWIAFALLAGTTLTTVLLVPVQRTFAGANRVAWIGGPRWWRRAVLGACGLSLASPVAALAVPSSDGAQHHCTGTCTPVPTSTFALSGLQLPDLPAIQPSTTGRRALVRIVRPGDSLWLIARAALPRSASASTICRRVDHLYAANHALIGPDPDLIFPGMELTQPGGTR